MRSFFLKNVDLFGAFTSGICAVHCIALPVVLSLGMIGEASGLLYHHFTELMIILLSMAMIYFSVWTSLRRGLELRTILLFSFGILLIIIGYLNIFNISHSLMALGGMLVSLGHYWSFLFGRKKQLSFVPSRS